MDIDQTSNPTHKFFLEKTLQFLVPISLISFSLSYFSLLPSLFQPLHLYSSIIPFLDTKCMFFICNAILAFLAKNLMLHDDSPLHHATKTFHGHEEIGALLFRGNDLDLDAAAVQEQQQQDVGVAAEEIERHEWEEEEKDDDDEEEEEVENSGSVMTEEVNDMRVSTEDLNKKFDEFIRKMKEDIRIEARQQYLILV